MRPGTLMFLLIATTACAPQPEPLPPASATDPTLAEPARRTLPQAILPDQTVIKLELATTFEEQRRGLMFRPSLPEDRGMLFLFAGEPTDREIWMKNTWVALDLVFLDAAGKVVRVTDNVPPCRVEPCPRYPSGHPVPTVLELAAGVAARHGVVEGATLSFEDVDGYPAAED